MIVLMIIAGIALVILGIILALLYVKYGNGFLFIPLALMGIFGGAIVIGFSTEEYERQECRGNGGQVTNSVVVESGTVVIINGRDNEFCVYK